MTTGIGGGEHGKIAHGAEHVTRSWTPIRLPDSELIPIMRFARVLRRDIYAVNNAIDPPWSNGQAEGEINRLKILKRAMYSTAGPELLRARMLPPRYTK